MSKLGIAGIATQIVPGLFQIRRRTWIALGVSLSILFALMIWAAVALLGWLWGQGRTATENMQNMPEVAQVIVSQAERVVPGLQEMRESIGVWIPALRPEAPPREVSGADIGPVARYPEMLRSSWQRDGAKGVVRYEGQVEFAAVLAHYAKGFMEHGYAQSVLAASPDSENHEYRKGDELIDFTLERLPGGRTAVTLMARLPSAGG